MPTSKVRVREFDPRTSVGLQYFQEVAIGSDKRPEVPHDILSKWAKTFQICLKQFDAELARIVQIAPQKTSVIHYLSTDDQYRVQEKDKPLGLASYTETIIGTNGSLYLEDARKIPLWKENYDQHQGFISVLGMPLEWPGHETYGTFEILSKKPMQISSEAQELFVELNQGIIGDLRQLHLEQQLEFFSTMDPLTNVHNRKVLQDWINSEFYRVKRTRNPFAMGMIHIKNLKELNKEYGRPVGDSTLEEIAQVLVDTIRTTDEIGRWSDSHFMVLCPDTGDAGAQTMKAKVESAFASHKFTEKVHVDLEFDWEIVNGDENIQAILNKSMHL